MAKSPVKKCQGRRQDGRLMPGYKLVKGGVVYVGRPRKAGSSKRKRAPARSSKRTSSTRSTKGAGAAGTGFLGLGLADVRFRRGIFRPTKRAESVVEPIRYDFSGHGPGAERWGGIAGLLEYKPAAPSIRRQRPPRGGNWELFG